MKLRRSLVVLLALAFISASAFAQGVQTATLTGTVMGPDGAPMPGVTVTAMSPNQIGERQTETGANGEYIIRGLAPGDYTVRFSLAGMQSTTSRIMLPLGGTTRVDSTMRIAAATETITVTGSTPSALETITVATNITKETVDQLPVVRTPVGIGSLSVAVTARTPVAGQLSISGGMAYDNAFLINGVNVQDPIFGQTNNLFIEDSILETQVLTSGISAEYGHFTGGVLNAITKSGGNEFTGSLRGNLTKPEWRDETPFEKSRTPPTKREGDLGKVYEATLGGPIMKDRLWFFVAGRDEESTLPAQLTGSGINLARVASNRRLEGKLTASILTNHTIQGSYIDNPAKATHEIQVSPIEVAAVGLNSVRENEGFVVNYNGLLANNLFAEARYSEKKFRFVGLGGTGQTIQESPFRSLAGRHASLRNAAGTYNAPYFDATDPEDRNNDQLYGALSYFLSTSRLGSHDIKGGLERFTVTRTGGNSQTSTDYVFYSSYVPAGTTGNVPALDSKGRMIPRFIPGRVTTGTYIGWWVATRGSVLDITTDSIYLNDRWDISPNFTLNLGLRHEIVNAEATGNITPIDTTTTVPRLGFSYDPLANGRFKFDVTYAEYAGRYNPAIAGDNTPVGNPALLYGYYNGPEGQGVDFAPGFDLNNYVFYYASVPTGNVFVEEGLSSPVNKEMTFSAGMSLPRGGWLKASYVDRKLKNVIEDFITFDQGCTNIVFEGVKAGCQSNIYNRNSDVPKREYKAVQLQARYGLMRNWMIEGNYTRQLRNHGNYEGEGGQGIGSSAIGNRPEIQSPREFPVGRLSQFQEDKVRLWTTYSLGLGRAGDLGLGLIYRYDSPQTFSYTTTQARTAIQRGRNPGYSSTPSATVFYGDRGIGEFDRSSEFDLSLTYGIPIIGRLEPWVKFDARNVLNNDSLLTHNTGISADPTSPLDENGLRTGFIRGAAFGRATGAGSYTTPREYLVTAGIRF